MTQGAAEQCLDRKVAADSFDVIWSLSGLFAKRNAQQDLRKVETGKEGGGRLDEPRIAVDITRQLRRFIEDIIERQGPMPVQMTAETVKMRTHDGPAHALLRGGAAAGAPHELTGDVHRDKPPAAEDGLGVFDRPGYYLLNEDGRGAGGWNPGDLGNGAVAIGGINDQPHGAARGTDRGFDHKRKSVEIAQQAGVGQDDCFRLRQIELGEHAAETGLAQCTLITLEIRQGDRDTALEPFPHPGEEKALLMDRQKHVEMAPAHEVFDELPEARGIGAQSRAAVIMRNKTREAAEAMRIRIADFDMVALKAQRGDSFARGGAGTFGKKDAKGKSALIS